MHRITKTRAITSKCASGGQRKRKKGWRKGLVLLALILCLFSLPVTAFAKPKENRSKRTEAQKETKKAKKEQNGTSSANDGKSAQKPADKQAGTAVSQPAAALSDAPVPPSGNLTLLEDVVSSVNGNREFLTVYSNDGHYFYIVIDRDHNGSGNVYFLNMVDDSDLFALTEKNAVGSNSLIGGTQNDICTCTTHCSEEKINEECGVCKRDFSKCECAEEEPDDEEIANPGKKNASPFANGGWKQYAVYAGTFLLIGAVFLVVALKKRKNKAKGGVPDYAFTDFDEFEEDEESES